MDIICILLTVYWLILIVRVLASWFPVPSSGPMRTLLNLVYDLTEPLLRAVRGTIPPMRMGAMGLDLSPIIIFIVLGILRTYIC
ncbi:YggT family protein [soil metagenome]